MLNAFVIEVHKVMTYRVQGDRLSETEAKAAAIAVSEGGASKRFHEMTKLLNKSYESAAAVSSPVVVDE